MTARAKAKSGAKKRAEARPARGTRARPKAKPRRRPAPKPPAVRSRVTLRATPSEIDKVRGAWVLHFPRFGKEGEHLHTYGQITPYFEGLAKGKLLGTRCVNAGCPVSRGRGEIWLPPRADCPDCHQPMQWAEVANPQGYVYTFTKVERGGTGLEIVTPYYQVDVKIPGVCTIVKSWLLDRQPIRIGDKVRARFRKGKEATHTCLDLCFELI